MEIGAKTRLLALLGRPVGHSLSPAMHNASFAAEKLDFVYVALEVDPDDVPTAVRGAGALGFRGFNVTMPHKRAVASLVDSLDEAARVSEAVNTVVVESGRLRGHNTDGSGLVEACGEAGVDLAGRDVLILGAGGAAAAIAHAFCDAGAGTLRILNRNAERAETLADRLREAGKETRIEAGPTDLLNEALPGTEIFVNTTPLGMKEGDALPVPPEYLTENTTIIDAVYLPGAETPLIRHARRRGATTIDGRRMLLYQGVQAQRLWTGHEPNVAAMDRALS